MKYLFWSCLAFLKYKIDANKMKWMNVSCSQMSISWAFIDFMSGSSRRKTKTCFFFCFFPRFSKTSFRSSNWLFWQKKDVFPFFCRFFRFLPRCKMFVKNRSVEKRGVALFALISSFFPFTFAEMKHFCLFSINVDVFSKLMKYFILKVFGILEVKNRCN